MEKRNGFNIGDKVVFIQDWRVYEKSYLNLKGMMGTVTHSTSNSVSWVLDVDGESWRSDPDQLILAKNQIVKDIINDLL